MCGIRIGCIVSKNKEVMSTCLKFKLKQDSHLQHLVKSLEKAALCTPTLILMKSQENMLKEGIF